MGNFVYAVSSVGFMVGGALVAKLGLSKRPLRILLLGNVAVSLVGMFMGIRESLWLLTAGMIAYMITIPVIEAAEQTTLQKIVPLAKQGRVFGFGQSVEAAASPVSAYLIGPVAQLWIIPYMASAEGRATWGWLVGSGEARGMALVFIGASLIMMVTALLAFRTRSYRQLSQAYRSHKA